jgi:hypothetical protein
MNPGWMMIDPSLPPCFKFLTIKPMHILPLEDHESSMTDEESEEY